MTDHKELIERLKNTDHNWHESACYEAADRIEALTAENERLKNRCASLVDRSEHDTGDIRVLRAENERLREALELALETHDASYAWGVDEDTGEFLSLCGSVRNVEASAAFRAGDRIRAVRNVEASAAFRAGDRIRAVRDDEFLAYHKGDEFIVGWRNAPFFRDNDGDRRFDCFHDFVIAPSQAALDLLRVFTNEASTIADITAAIVKARTLLENK